MESLIPTFGGLIWTIAAFIIALSVIVAIHEYGHYIVGKWSGIKAEVFSIGFGPVLASRIGKDGTKWQIAALPFGGYVKFLGDTSAASDKPDQEVLDEMSAEERRRTMHGAPLWARAATVVAGPLFNFILSFILFCGLVMYRGVMADPLTVEELRTLPNVVQELQEGDVILEIDGQSVPMPDQFADFTDQLEPAPTLEYRIEREGQEMTVTGPWLYPPLVSGTTPNSAAADADLQEGDVVLSANGTSIFDFDQLRDIVGDSEGNDIVLEVWREGEETLTKILSPTRRDLPLADGGFETRWLIGMNGGLLFQPASQPPTFVETISYGANQIVFIIKSSLSGLYHMVAGKISTCNLSGPIGIAETSGQAASQGAVSFIWFIALLSTAVGMLNLFPIPVLDGGHLVFHAYEWATGRPPSDRALKIMMATGLSLMLMLMVFAVATDLVCP